MLFQVSDKVYDWTDEQLYAALGKPKTEPIIAEDGSDPEPHAPAVMVEPLLFDPFIDAGVLQAKVTLIDFGQSYFHRPPQGYEVAGPLHYRAPELFFDSQADFASDIWALACTTFQLRTGNALLDDFLASKSDTLASMVQTFGKFPEPWWTTWKDRENWFEESGEAVEYERSEEAMEEGGPRETYPHPSAGEWPIRRLLGELGKNDSEIRKPLAEPNMIEKRGVQLKPAEAELLEDLLTKMLQYRSEDRISMEEVVKHPWYAYTD